MRHRAAVHELEPRLGGRLPIVAGSLAAWLAIVAAHRDASTLPFGNDDYLMLERTARSSFGSWWSGRELFVGWWRPWSREMHVGLLQRMFGANESAFHVASLVLAAFAMAALVVAARRLSGPRVGALAVCGVAAMSAWAYPALVAAGAQDLWMLLAALVALLSWIAGRRVLATFAFTVALASKETAAMVPVLFVAFDVLLGRQSVRAALRRATVPLLLLVPWVAFHPHLGGGGFAHVGGAESATGVSPTVPVVVGRTFAALVSIDARPAPESGWPAAGRAALPIAACLLLAYALLRRGPASDAPSRDRLRVAMFAAAWAVCGWLPLLLPGLGWHAYYALFGALGAWLALAVALERLGTPAQVGLVALLAVLSAARADTPTHDWADAQFVRRAASYVGPLRASLLHQLPTVPPQSRLYFTGLPPEIGFVTGEGTMFRVLYRDPTLRGAFLAEWKPRAATEPPGQDYFFHGDTGPAFRRMTEGPPPSDAERRARLQWADDQRLLAATFERAGDLARAAAAYARIADAAQDR